jgi:hypothetical protein
MRAWAVLLGAQIELGKTNTVARHGMKQVIISSSSNRFGDIHYQKAA